MEQRKFSHELKIEALKLVRERGVKMAQVVSDLDAQSRGPDLGAVVT